MTGHVPRCSACAGHPQVVWEALCAECALCVDPEVLATLRVLAERRPSLALVEG